MLRLLPQKILTQTRRFAVDGFGRVKTGPKMEKLVKNLKKGDEVLTPYGPAKILEVTKQNIPNGFYEMAEFNQMLITPNHPIKIYDEWTLPKEVQEIKFAKCQAIYSVKIDKYHILTINGNNIQCET